MYGLNATQVKALSRLRSTSRMYVWVKRHPKFCNQSYASASKLGCWVQRHPKFCGESYAFESHASSAAVLLVMPAVCIHLRRCATGLNATKVLTLVVCIRFARKYRCRERFAAGATGRASASVEVAAGWAGTTWPPSVVESQCCRLACLSSALCIRERLNTKRLR